MKHTINWQPIESAPKDNRRALYLAEINDDGVILHIDIHGTWKEDEGWEISSSHDWGWFSDHGIEDPTHWAYMYEEDV